MYLPPDPPLPEPDPACSEIVSNIERTIAKFKAATFRVGFNLWDIFRDVDEHRTHFISESKFLSVLLGPLRDIIGLQSTEIAELTNYLRKPDGRIAYTQLCKLVHETEDPIILSKEEADREDGLKSNQLSIPEEEKVLELLTKINIAVPPDKMIVKPFFQDYELLRRGSGQVSKNTFARVLNFLGVSLTPDEFKLLFDKYRYDAFTVKYNAFLKDVDQVHKYLEDHDYLDLNGFIRPEKLGKVPTLPRPELIPAPRGPEQGIKKVWSKNWHGQVLGVEAAMAFNKIKEHVLREKLRVEDYLKLFDEDKTGRVAKIVFEKCIYEWVCVSETCFNNLYISPKEMNLLHSVYADPYYTNKVLWVVFMDDLERDIPEEELATWPRRGNTRVPANPFVVLYRPPTPPQSQEANLTDTLEHIRNSMEARPDSRKLLSVLSKYDRENYEISKWLRNRLTRWPLTLSLDGCNIQFVDGKNNAMADFLYHLNYQEKNNDLNGTCYRVGSSYIDSKQFDWSFIECGIYLNPNEKQRLHENYSEHLGVNWRAFVEDLQAHEESISIAKKQKEMEYVKSQTEKEGKLMAEMMETNIVEVLAKIKRHIICKRVWIKDYLKEFDKHQKHIITKDEFIRGLDSCGVTLTKNEMDTLLQVFSLPSDPSAMDYIRFCRTVDEESIPPCHTRPPLKEAMASEEAKKERPLPEHQFANFEERQVLANAMDKIIKYVSLANTNFFKSIDKTGEGIVTRVDFQKALYKLNCLHLLTNKELDTIIHCFGIRHGLEVRLDYMSLLNALDITFKTKKAAKSL